ncbi:MAG: sugar porter family MFS transporter [Reyranella sp.]|nr:sugar porter family MFS transporter [Reyranella sp.]MBN9539463.1 sugar porter family MFS transporter [Alphaproteobacteria bacterium]MBR2814344.1 sugar porter family MFS transporter [Reyranella sp.]
MIILIGLVAAMSGLLIGYNTAVIAPALEFVTRDFALGPFTQGVAVSSVLFGGFVGALFSGGLIRRTGERPALFATALLFAVGGVGAALSESFLPWLLWRTVTGFGVGAATMVAPLYVSETVPSRVRGALVSIIQLTITLGILASYIAGTVWTPAQTWQPMLLVGAAPALLLILVIAAVPESPRWYLLHGRTAEAERAHRRLNGENGDPLPAQAADGAAGHWRDLFGGRNVMVLILATGLFAFANLSGIDAILYYAPVIFAEVGFGGAYGPILATVAIGVINVIATLIAMALIDRLGRRPLLIGGLVPMAASLIVLAVVLANGQGAAWSNIVAVACLGLFVLAFGISLGPLPYVLMSELFPLALRGAGMGIASATAWGVNVLVSLTFPVLVEEFGLALVLGSYGVISIAALLFVLALVPETRGRSLELIEANLASGRPVRDLGLPLAAPARSG